MSLIGWLFNTPQHKFEKAEIALASNDTRTSMSLLKEIQEEHNKAPIKIAEIKLLVGKALFKK
jgi:hypothetical protein